MTQEKISTLKLLKKGIGNTVSVIEAVHYEPFYQIKAYLHDVNDESMIPVLFLVSSLAFLEATKDESNEFQDVDGWTMSDFLSHLRVSGNSGLMVSVSALRGRRVNTEICLSSDGNLSIVTKGRGQSAQRWIGFVKGQSHLQKVV